MAAPKVPRGPKPDRRRSVVLFRNLPPGKAKWCARQLFAFVHMFHLPGPRAKDVQLLVVSGRRRVRAGLVFLPLCHARL